MASERIQRRIDRLLNQLDEAEAQGDWESVRALARDVLGIDPENIEAVAYLESSDRRLDAVPVTAGAQPDAAPPSTPTTPVATPAQPTSFADRRYQVKRFLGEGGKKKVYLAHDTTLDRDVAFALIKTEGLSHDSRIFEGTNEINRMLIPGMLIRRALKGELPLIPAARHLQEELLSPSTPAARFTDDGVLDEALSIVSAFKKVALMVLGTAMQTYGQKLNDEQEVLGYAADIMIDTYAAESAVLRARAASAAAHPRAGLHEAAARTFVNEAALRVEGAARNALAAMADGDTLRVLLAALRRVLKVTPINTVALRRRLAEASVERGRYILES